MDVDIGSRLKSLRKAQGLSQRQLAARTGVTHGLISMIEQNKTSPSISSLKKILDGFPMSLSEFFDTTTEASDQVFFTRAELTAINPELRFANGSQDGLAALSMLQVGWRGRHALQMLHETYAPGADTGLEPYSHEAEEAGIVIEGEIELTVGDETRTLKKGDAYIFDSRQPHRFHNTSGRTCILVSACTPPTF